LTRGGYRAAMPAALAGAAAAVTPEAAAPSGGARFAVRQSRPGRSHDAER